MGSHGFCHFMGKKESMKGIGEDRMWVCPEASRPDELDESTSAAVCNPAFPGKAEAESEAREQMSTSGWQDDAEVGGWRARGKDLSARR